MATLLQKSKHVVRAICLQDKGFNLQQTRSKVLRGRKGKAPHLVKSWAERVKEIERQEEIAAARVNIGFQATPTPHINKFSLRKLRQDMDLKELEMKAWRREIKIPIEDYTAESFKTDRQHFVKGVADYYGIYRDLYENAYFYPQIPIDVLYEVKEDPSMANPVYYGNILEPAEVANKPTVCYPAEDKLYTLCMTAPDSHLQEKNKEYLHWLVGNIPASNIEEGELLCDYLIPFPVKGTGHHRYVFILYQQEKKIDFSQERRPEKCTSLRERTFDTFEFLKKYQDDMTPVGLAFFQSEYDETVRNTFHTILEMDEPRYEFLHPLKYIPRQKLWPIREPFNVYLDRYRDVKDINEEVLLEKLKMAEPFKPREPPKKYPNIYKISKDVPSWLKLKIRDKRLRKSYWKGLDD